MTELVSSSTFVQDPTNSGAHRGQFYHNCFPQKLLKEQETRAAHSLCTRVFRKWILTNDVTFQGHVNCDCK